jgi:hypothetical protein
MQLISPIPWRSSLSPLSEVPKRKTLQSWKEIAVYLDVTVRSVQRWEKESGLPIYRQGTGAKARVFAYSDELQRWLHSGGMPDVKETVKTEFPRVRWIVYLGITGLAITVIGGILILWRSGVFPFTRVPQRWHFGGSTFSVMDAKGRLCWEKQFWKF